MSDWATCAMSVVALAVRLVGLAPSVRRSRFKSTTMFRLCNTFATFFLVGVHLGHGTTTQNHERFRRRKSGRG